MIKKKILLQFLSFLQHHCRTAVLWWTNASFVQHVVAIYLYLTSTLRRSMRARFDFAPFAYPFILRGTQIHSQNWFFVHVEVSFWQHQKSSHGTNSGERWDIVRMLDRSICDWDKYQFITEVICNQYHLLHAFDTPCSHMKYSILNFERILLCTVHAELTTTEEMNRNFCRKGLTFTRPK